MQIYRVSDSKAYEGQSTRSEPVVLSLIAVSRVVITFFMAERERETDMPLDSE